MFYVFWFIHSFIQFEPKSSFVTVDLIFNFSFFLSLPDVLKRATTFLTFLHNSKRGAKTHEVKVNNNNIWLFINIAFFVSLQRWGWHGKNQISPFIHIVGKEDNGSIHSSQTPPDHWPFGRSQGQCLLAAQDNRVPPTMMRRWNPYLFNSVFVLF